LSPAPELHKGVNATKGSQVERRRRENRGAVSGEGVESGDFSSRNSVIWCILGVLFLRFMCPMDCTCILQMKMTATCGIQKFR